MSKRRLANGRNDGPVRYVRLDHYMLKTEAWKALGAVPRAILIEIKFRYNGTNNGRIPYSIREAAAALKIGKSTAGEAFDALQAKGFIAAVNKGTFHRK